MAVVINDLEVSIAQLKESRMKEMQDLVKEKERIQGEVTKAMYKVRGLPFSTYAPRGRGVLKK